MLLRAYAKINWMLDIVAKRPDGYHELDMLMQSISLFDALEIREAGELSLTIQGAPIPADDRNLVMRAARALCEATGEVRGARMNLVKHIPVQSGLGGGSADAAAALIGLNEHWGLNLPMERLLEIGGALGADVPFCLTGGLARAQGFGERLTRLAPEYDAPLRLVVLKPCRGLSTRDVFARVSLENALALRSDAEAAQRALITGDLDALSRAARNALYPIACAMRPRLHEAVSALMSCGARFAAMSGSGTAVFGAFAGAEAAARAHARLNRRYPYSYLAHTQSQGVAQWEDRAQ